jgi:predicted metal-dependent enzyme (double-stranded beta helix superfamily)
MRDAPRETSRSIRDRTPALSPPGRLLRPDELAATAATIAARPAMWRHLVDANPSRREYESLYVDEHLGVWVIAWMPGHDTGFHDHDASCGGVAVAEGTIREQRPVLDGPARTIDPVAGGSFCFDADEIHRMVNVSDAPAITIHAYSLPLKRMGAYRVEADGSVRRRAIGWDTRLEPGC